MGAPADAIREFTRVLAESQIVTVPSQAKTDIAELRRAFPADDDFAAALASVTRRLRSLPTSDSSELDHELSGWLRVKFSSTVADHADLRIIYRNDPHGTQLLAFGHRHDPESVYHRAAKR